MAEITATIVLTIPSAAKLPFGVGPMRCGALKRARVSPPPISRAKSTLVRLTNNNAMDGAPVWSPDGSRKLAFHSNRDGDYEIYVMNLR